MIYYIKSGKDLASSLITSLGMVGKFMGALLAGWYTDKFGRKNSLMVYTFCHVVFTFAMAFCQNEWSFTAMRVMTMCVNVSDFHLLFPVSTGRCTLRLNFEFQHICWISFMSYSVEILGPSKRSISGTLTHIYYGVGYMVTSLLAYLCPDWRDLTITIGVIMDRL